MISKDVVNSSKKIMYSGMIQLFILLFLIIYPLIIGPELRWPLWSSVLLIISIGLLVLFIRKQKGLYRQKLPSLVDFSLFKNRVFNLGLIAAIAYYMVQDAYFIINSNYLQNYRDFTPTMTGIAFVYQGIGYVIASLIASRLIDKYGKSVILVGLLIMITGLLAHLVVFNQPEVDVNQIHLLFFFYGIGCGTVLPSLMTLALRDLDKTLIGVGSALYLTVQQLSICLGIAFIVGLYLNYPQKTFFHFSQLSSAYGYSSLVSVILLILVAYVINLLFTNTKSK